ncbi:unnamed protein product [Spirodela intermedia]|uniref:Uncharacterized protein n=1 Tax=Spirodela intermedia TaxID=51605 RepID=A0A7I8K3K6_SPIIN|nr:unnamed protein product [Spirodela intermedia]
MPSLWMNPRQPPVTSSSGDPFLWNAFIKTSSHGPDPGGAVLTFSRMVAHGILPDRFSFSLNAQAIFYLLQPDHQRILHDGHDAFWHIDAAARHLFAQMPARDSFSWNSMIDGLVKCGRLADAAALFEQMPEKNVLAWASMIYGHMEAGNVELARALFNEMPDKDLITWNIMISGYAKNGCFIEALSLFQEMPSRGKLHPDSTTLAAALSAIAELGQINDGLSIHEYIQRN